MCTLHILYNVLCPLPFVLVYFFLFFFFSVYFLFILISRDTEIQEGSSFSFSLAF